MDGYFCFSGSGGKLREICGGNSGKSQPAPNLAPALLLVCLTFFTTFLYFSHLSEEEEEYFNANGGKLGLFFQTLYFLNHLDKVGLS